MNSDASLCMRLRRCERNIDISALRRMLVSNVGYAHGMRQHAVSAERGLMTCRVRRAHRRLLPVRRRGRFLQRKGRTVQGRRMVGRDVPCWLRLPAHQQLVVVSVV